MEKIDYSLGSNALLEVLESKGYSSAAACAPLLKLVQTLESLYPNTETVTDEMLMQALNIAVIRAQDKVIMVDVAVKCMLTESIFGTEPGSYRLQNLAIRAGKLCSKKLTDFLG